MVVHWCLKCVIMYFSRDIPVFVMYCVYGESGSSPLIESTYSMIRTLYYTQDYLLDYLLMVVMFFAKSVYSNSDRQTYTFLNVFSYLHHIYIYRIFHNEFWKTLKKSTTEFTRKIV